MDIFDGTTEELKNYKPLKELREYKLNGPYKGLAQPLEGKNGYSEEFFGAIINSNGKIQKEEIIQIYNLKTGEIKEEYTGKVEYILEYLNKKYSSNNFSGAIGDIIKADAEYFLQKINKTK